MKRFKVICIAVGGKGNNLFHYGDVVTEDQFLPDHADAYVKSGHLEVKKLTKAEKEADATKAKADAVYVADLEDLRKAQVENKEAQDVLNRAGHQVDRSEKNKLTNDQSFESAKDAQEKAVEVLTAAETAKETTDAALKEAEEAKKALAKNAAKAKKEEADKAVTDAKVEASKADKAVTDAQADKDASDSTFDSAKSIQAANIKSLGNLQKDLDEAQDAADKAAGDLETAEATFEKAKEAKAKAYK